MKVMSLFAGIGGFDLAAEWMGWDTIIQIEIDEWCRKVLAKNFPNAKRHDNIKTFDGTPWQGSIDLVCGGFPCQPYSNAGKRLGKADERHLWPEMFRVIREVSPRWVVGENVGGLLSWNKGLVFHEVCTDLEAAGYEVQSFVLPACGVNAPHKRDRVWIIAHAEGIGRHDKSVAESREYKKCEPTRGCNSVKDAPYPTGEGLSKSRQARIGQLQAESGTRIYDRPKQRSVGNDWTGWPTQSPICLGNDGISARLDRTRTIKGGGNAVVPRLVYQIFQAIQYTENLQIV